MYARVKKKESLRVREKVTSGLRKGLKESFVSSLHYYVVPEMFMSVWKMVPLMELKQRAI